MGTSASAAEGGSRMKIGDKVQVEGDKQGDYWLVELGRADNGAGIETATVEDETGWKWTMDREDVKPV